MKQLPGILAFVVLAVSTWITLTDRWIAPDINFWQAGILGENKYYPFLTIAILALPVLAVLAVLKVWMRRRNKS